MACRMAHQISLAEAQKRAEPAKNEPSAAEHSGKAWFFPLSGERCLFLGHLNCLMGSERVEIVCQGVLI